MSDLSVKINFLIASENDPFSIVIRDTSNWGVAQGQPAYLQVTPPGSTKSVSLNFAKESITILNSVNLGLSCYIQGCDDQDYQELYDGIWEICLLSSYQDLNKKRFYLKTDSLRLELDKIYIRAGLDYDPNSEVIKALRKVEFLITSAEVYIRRGDTVKAKTAFDEAVKLTEQYSKCKDCY